MNEVNKKYLEWDYDYKEKLLGTEKYEKASNPIENILLAKNKKNYENPEGTKGHIENYTEVNTIFKKVFNIDDNVLSHKDIMNSFWTTYKFYLQLEYPAIFMPKGNLRDKKPLTKPKSSQLPKVYAGYPPYTIGSNSQSLDKKYIEYYKQYFPDLLFPFQKEINEGKCPLWIDFLLKNFKSFDRVNQDKNLKKFALLTHTIGNISVVPKGFNAGRNNYDYWDYALCDLREFLCPISGWKNFVQKYFLEEYVCDSYSHVLPFWENHLDLVLPKNIDQLDLFVTTVNQRIENRGKKIISEYKK